MTTCSRRTLLKGLLAGAGLAALGPLGPLGRLGAVADVAGGTLPGPGSLPFPSLPPGTDTIPQIDHIVILMMENHSFDNYLGMLGRGDGFTLGPDGQPAASCPDASGAPVRAFHAPNLCQSGGPVLQSWDASHQAWDSGANDGFVVASSSRAMTYWTGTDLPFLYALAGSFPVCDRYFCSMLGPTYPNRRFLLAASALGLVTDQLPSLTDPLPPEGTIFDRLSAYGISWRDYFVDLPTAGLFPYLLTKYPGNILPVTSFFADAALGTLPGVSLVDPEAQAGSEESPQDIAIGAAYAASVINAVLASPAWPRTLLVFTYDEHGGYYDHVPPPAAPVPDGIPPQITVPPDLPGGFDRYGFRVPTVIASPWAKPNYVSHVVSDHTSILKLIETKWNLPALSYRDANASNLLDCVDFTAPRPPFLVPPTLPGPNLAPGTITCLL